MSKEVYDRILAQGVDYKEDLFELIETGELTVEEYDALVDELAQYIDPTQGSLADPINMIEVKRDR